MAIMKRRDDLEDWGLFRLKRNFRFPAGGFPPHGPGRAGWRSGLGWRIGPAVPRPVP